MTGRVYDVPAEPSPVPAPYVQNRAIEPDHHSEPTMPVPRIPRGFILVPVRTVRDVSVIVAGLACLGSQIWLSIRHETITVELIYAGVGLIGAVPIARAAERRHD
jgi:hypothetical protein